MNLELFRVIDLSFLMRRTTKRSTSSAKRLKKVKEDDLVFHWVGKGEKRDRSYFL